MNKRRPTPYQYPPLTTPQGWTGDERLFALRLKFLLDTLFERVAKLEKEDSSS